MVTREAEVRGMGLLAFEDGKRARSQGMWQLLEAEKGKETGFLESPKGTQPQGHLFLPVTLILEPLTSRTVR